MYKKEPDIKLVWEEKGAYHAEHNCVLKHNSARSYGAKKSGNLLIYGDNITALRFLLKSHKNIIKCIYTDPPFNSQTNFEHYDDDEPHSKWLGQMFTRIKLMRELLASDGMIFMQIDNRELHYLKILMDEVFGRANYKGSIIVNKTVTHALANKPHIAQLTPSYDSILMYSKVKNAKFPRLILKNDNSSPPSFWRQLWCSLSRDTNRYLVFGRMPKRGGWRWNKLRTYRAIKNFTKFENHLSSNKMECQTRAKFDTLYNKYLIDHCLTISDFELVRSGACGRPEYYIPNTSNFLVNDNWTDLGSWEQKTSFEHEISEEIVVKILEWVTTPGEYVLDGFLGSGTVAAVAQSLKRRWIGIEQGDHCWSHCVPRINSVINSMKCDFKGKAYKSLLGYDFLECMK